MSAKMAANGIRTYARTNQRHTVALRSQQTLNAGQLTHSDWVPNRGRALMLACRVM